jgi:hypothetical protein
MRTDKAQIFATAEMLQAVVLNGHNPFFNCVTSKALAVLPAPHRHR